MKIGFSVGYFLGWEGGKALISGIIRACQIMPNVEIIVGVKRASIDNIIELTKDVLKNYENPTLFNFCVMSNIGKICIFNDEENWIIHKNISLFGPTFDKCQVPIPRISYIPDFQHKYLPQYFSDEELAQRELAYASTIRSSRCALVGDQSVADDIERFYPWSSLSVFLLPRFLINYSDLTLQNTLEDQSPPLIMEDYFIVCSQRWQHKRHDLVLMAFACYLKKIPPSEKSKIKLIFTGPRHDYRVETIQNSFLEVTKSLGISENVIDLGVVDRSKQLHLIKHAVALITASEFEGGIGASGLEEAALLGVQIIAPDSKIFMQNYPVKINNCNFSNPEEAATILEKTQLNLKTKSKPAQSINYMYAAAVSQLNEIFLNVKGSNPSWKK